VINLDKNDDIDIKVSIIGLPQSGKSTIIYLLTRALQDIGMKVTAYDSEPLKNHDSNIHLKCEALRGKKISIHTIALKSKDFSSMAPEMQGVEALRERVRDSKRRRGPTDTF